MTGGGGVVESKVDGEDESRKRHPLGDFLRSAFADVPEPERYDPTWYSNELRGEFGHLGSRQLSGPVLPRAYQLTTADLDLLDDTDGDGEEDQDDGFATITSTKLMSPFLRAASAAHTFHHAQPQPMGPPKAAGAVQLTITTGRSGNDTRIKPIKLNMVEHEKEDEKENHGKKQEKDDCAAVDDKSTLVSPVTSELALTGKSRDEVEEKRDKVKDGNEGRQSRGLRISFRRSRKILPQTSSPTGNPSPDSRISRLFRHSKKPIQSDHDAEKQRPTTNRRRSLLHPKRTVNR